MAATESLPLASEHDGALIRQAIRRICRQIGFNIVEQTKMVTAASELLRNALVYGGGGRVEIEIVEKDCRKGLQLTVIDYGPGIEDLSLAMKDGYSTGTGLGMGLPGAKRLVNEFKITSRSGEGTTVVVTRWK